MLTNVCVQTEHNQLVHHAPEIYVIFSSYSLDFISSRYKLTSMNRLNYCLNYSPAFNANHSSQIDLWSIRPYETNLQPTIPMPYLMCTLTMRYIITCAPLPSDCMYHLSARSTSLSLFLHPPTPYSMLLSTSAFVSL